ncbi:MAG: ATP-binding protein [Deltaproteobacteria bacterium]|nr:ATP-binding protein [Deltaproteobacteria bacterium]MBW2084131.1 ATP-binding protein [Deltaproteobacteria bacterium]HDM10337.1 ATP-binding protein [Desulfobacteraceae bacterium]
MIPRTLEATIKRAMKTFPAVLVTGPRQAGKTTLLRERFARSHSFVSLENPDVRSRILDDPAGFLKYSPPPLILDEIQYVPQLLHYIKSSIDEDRKPGQWLLSGSQNFALMEGISQSLSGRVAVLNLLPFSLRESQGDPSQSEAIDDLLNGVNSTGDTMSKNNVSLEDWLLRGAYPEIRSNRNVDRKLWCASYIQTYLERDVRQLINVGDLNTFNRFLRICATRTGQILNISELARDIGVSVPTAKKWLTVLEASYQVFLLPPYFKNFGKRIIKSPKLYFLDTGIATFLLGLHEPEPLLQGPMLGPIFETMVVSEWVKAFYHRGERPELYYWRSKGGLEVDLIIDRNGKLYPIEIKSTATLLPSHIKPIERWRALAGALAGPGMVIADITEPFKVRECTAVPWSWGVG